jgi:type IV pilus assembly protein PilB
MSAGKLGDLLVAQGVVTQEQLRAAIEQKNKSKGRLSSALVQLGHVNEKVLATFLSKQYGIPAIALDEVAVPKEVTTLIPYNLCEKHVMMPLSLENNRLSLVISDPTNVSAIDDVRFLSNLDVVVYLSTETAIRSLLERSYQGAAGASLRDAVKVDIGRQDIETDEKTGFIEIGAEAETHEVENERVGDKPVIRLINKLLLEAVRRKVSDIHIEPFDNHSRVRFRVDGSLHEVMRLPPQLKSSTPARVKVMAQLDISEKRLPQDGRIQVRTQSRKIDIRVSILPTMFGEKVVMRLLDQGNTTPSLTALGFEEEQLKLFKKAAGQPYGMILVTGPTGSGKSTTLYGALSELNSPDVNISTVEDPVEYNMVGINQVQMKEGIGLNFAAALRSLLRQDPDIVMVGEVRDHETAEIAIKAALTGHMVFSTLHTNDAPSTITRLVHMGVEPFLITAALTLVQAQRLVRINCEHCIQVDTKVTPEMLTEAELPQHWMDSVKPMRGKGCDRCGTTGYKGRKGIFEVMYMTEKLREMVIKGVNADALKKAAIEDGMITLRQSGLLKLYRGETTLEEVLNNSRPDGDLFKS